VSHPLAGAWEGNRGHTLQRRACLRLDSGRAPALNSTLLTTCAPFGRLRAAAASPLQASVSRRSGWMSAACRCPTAPSAAARGACPQLARLRAALRRCRGCRRAVAGRDTRSRALLQTATELVEETPVQAGLVNATPLRALSPLGGPQVDSARLRTPKPPPRPQKGPLGSTPGPAGGALTERFLRSLATTVRPAACARRLAAALRGSSQPAGPARLPLRQALPGLQQRASPGWWRCQPTSGGRFERFEPADSPGTAHRERSAERRRRHRCRAPAPKRGWTRRLRSG